MKDIQILSSDKAGFEVIHRFENWQIGMINYIDGAESAYLENLEKHIFTDEAFVLIKGESSLFIGEELKETKMKKGYVYNVPQNTWHTMTLSKDACVIVFENLKTEANDKIKFK